MVLNGSVNVGKHIMLYSHILTLSFADTEEQLAERVTTKREYEREKKKREGRE